MTEVQVTYERNAAIGAEMAACMAEHEERSADIEAIFDGEALSAARKAIYGVTYQPSREMAVREVLANTLNGTYAARVLRRYLKLSRAKRRGAAVVYSAGGVEVRVSKWGA